MNKLSSLKNQYAGRPAAVLGGGPSLPADMCALPEDCIQIAVNAHPYCIGVCDPDFLVFMDDPTQDPLMMQVVAGSSGLKVCPDLTHTDVDLRGMPDNVSRFSGVVAAWLATWLGCDPIILCGMDLYQGERKYCHESYTDRPIYSVPLADHLSRWRTLPEVSHLRAVSGPLMAEFGNYSNA